MKKKLPILLTLILTLILCVCGLFACVGNEDGGNTDGRNQDIVAVYNSYVEYSKSTGEEPLPYELWLASIKGKDGETPQLRINGTTNYWEVSYDNGATWQSLNVKATGSCECESGGGEDYSDLFIFAGNTIVGVTSYATTLTEIVIPERIDGEKVIAIDEEAFIDCERLQSITIPKTVKIIENDAFYNYESLTKVNYLGTVDEWANISFCGIRTTYSDYSSNPLGVGADLYINGVKQTDIVINTPFVNDNAFACCKSITKVTLGNSVTNIEDWAFYNCSNLTSVVFGNSITKIGEFAFCDCDGLTDIVIPNSVTSIGESAFSGCDNLDYTTEGSLEYLGNSSNPYLCLIGVTDKSIITVTINNNCKVIGDYALRNFDNLTSIVIPNSVTSIGERAFSGCDSLTIYCEAESAPSGWSWSWNSSNRPVVWGHTIEE